MIINGVELLSISQLVEKLQCSPGTAYKIAKEIGTRIPKPNGRWFVYTNELLKYLTIQGDGKPQTQPKLELKAVSQVEERPRVNPAIQIGDAKKAAIEPDEIDYCQLVSPI